LHIFLDQILDFIVLIIHQTTLPAIRLDPTFAFTNIDVQSIKAYHILLIVSVFISTFFVFHFLFGVLVDLSHVDLFVLVISDSIELILMPTLMLSNVVLCFHPFHFVIFMLVFHILVLLIVISSTICQYFVNLLSRFGFPMRCLQHIAIFRIIL